MTILADIIPPPRAFEASTADPWFTLMLFAVGIVLAAGVYGLVRVQG